jgi:hypothetical protein
LSSNQTLDEVVTLALTSIGGSELGGFETLKGTRGGVDYTGKKVIYFPWSSFDHKIPDTTDTILAEKRENAFKKMDAVVKEAQKKSKQAGP